MEPWKCKQGLLHNPNRTDIFSRWYFDFSSLQSVRNVQLYCSVNILNVILNSTVWLPLANAILDALVILAIYGYTLNILLNNLIVVYLYRVWKWYQLKMARLKRKFYKISELSGVRRRSHQQLLLLWEKGKKNDNDKWCSSKRPNDVRRELVRKSFARLEGLARQPSDGRIVRKSNNAYYGDGSVYRVFLITERWRAGKGLLIIFQKIILCIKIFSGFSLGYWNNSVPIENIFWYFNSRDTHFCNF